MTTSSLFSPSWYRVAGLKPRLRSHVEIHRHHYRGELWYVLEDRISGQFQRFTPSAYQIIGLMDGRRTVQEIWDVARDRLKEDTPTQEEVIRLLSQLHASDALQADVIPDPSEMLKRFEKKRKAKWIQNLRSPLFMRFSLFDPDRFLVRHQGLAKPFYGWAGFILWVFVVATGVFLAGLHWSELTENITDRVLAPANLVLLWLTYPFLKILHEFGHAFAVKTRKGEVHDMGIMLLVLTPVPYVDASAASAFRERRDRIMVGAAGMAVEVFVASLALFAWVNSESGLIRSILYNVIFIAGVSSLLFNGNPLLRYDAYYILSDLIEIPNLATRGLKYTGYLAQRYLLGSRNAEPPLSTAGERVWFVGYTLFSWVYRLLIYGAIVLFIAGEFFFVGALFAVWAAINMFLLPAAKGVKFLVSSPGLRRSRFRAVAVSGLIVACLLALVCLMPFPLSTKAEGVVWIPEDSFVRAGTDGFVERVMAEPGSRVKKEEILIECSDPLLPAQIRVFKSKLDELEAVYDAQILTNRVKADMTKEEMAHMRAKLENARERESQLGVRSSRDGTFLALRTEDLPGRFVKRGELLGYVVDPIPVTARVVVSQGDVDLVRIRTHGVSVRFPETIGETATAKLLREVPAATDQLPGRTLTLEGGGEIPVDPQDRFGMKAFQKIFLFDLELSSDKSLYSVGGRIHVRFDHGAEPLVWRWGRDLRRLFLKRFSV
jgi:putative peptide zinc metalloprotease protein